MPFECAGKEDLWRHNDGEPLALGCRGCPLSEACGGLHISGPAFDCMSFCDCEDPTSCDTVCFRNAGHFAARARDVQGFDLNQIPRLSRVSFVPMHGHAPLLYHGSTRATRLSVPIIALSLYSVFDRRSGQMKYRSREELAAAFKFSSEARIVLSGTAPDGPLERWWKLPTRDQLIPEIRRLGIELVTAPNYSLFNDVPRPDNLYNMMRIMWTWAEFCGLGIPCALHINARTTHDYERWADIVAARGEVTHLSVEFATGAGFPSRIRWHAEQLCRLAARCSRPLQLVIRGGLEVLPILRAAYEGVLVIDTSPFIKTMRRQLEFLTNQLSISETPAPTAANAPLDELLDRNVRARSMYHAAIVSGETVVGHPKVRQHPSRASRCTSNAHQESLQMSFLDQLCAVECRPTSIDNERVIAASNSDETTETRETDDQWIESSAVPAT